MRPSRHVAAVAILLGALAAPLLAAVPASAIVGGHNADDSYSFMGSLQRLESPRDDLHACGVALLTPTIAITAGHCTRSGADIIDRPTSGHPANWQVRFGSNQVDSGGQLVAVKRFTQLNNRYFTNDLALLELADPVDGATIAIADAAPVPGDDVRILGWGMTCDDVSDDCFPKHLQEADTTVLDPAECAVEGEDLCIGALDGSVAPENMDSGGPAIVQRDGRWELVGAAEGGGAGTPGYYTNLIPHRAWIDGLASGSTPFPEDTPFPTDALSGTVRTDGGCTGAVFQTPSSQPGDPALMLTNGHCADPMPEPDRAVVGEEADAAVLVLDEHGDTTLRARTTALGYATMTGTDIAVYSLDKTYAQLEEAGVLVRTVSSDLPQAGQDVRLLAGGSAVALDCRIGEVVPTLREGGYELHGAIRYADGQECSNPDSGATHGDSGSVLVDVHTDQIVGVHNTSVDGSDEACTDNNACEVSADGTSAVYEGGRYGQRVNMLAACFTVGSVFAADAEGCTLTAAGDTTSQDTSAFGSEGEGFPIPVLLLVVGLLLVVAFVIVLCVRVAMRVRIGRES